MIYTCPRCCLLSLLPVLLIINIADPVRGAPRPNTDLSPLRGAAIRGGKGGGWGLKLDTLPIQNSRGENDLNMAIEHILRNNNSPSMRLFLHDKLFLHHLRLLLDQPSRRHYNQLQTRFKTLLSRRTGEMSSRFFLRD